MDVNSSCAFTGHRPHKFPWRYNESDPACTALKTILFQQVMKLVQTGITDYYSGMADGSDVWLSQIVLSIREKNPALRLYCLLPCEGQERKWNEIAQKRYHSILEQANGVRYISRRYYEGCMLERNRQLVNSAGILLAVYNGEQRGGTAATVRYARKLKRRIIIVEPYSHALTFEGDIPDTRIKPEIIFQ